MNGSGQNPDPAYDQNPGAETDRAGQEPERYELTERPGYQFGVDRRDFFRATGAGIVIFGVMSRVEGVGAAAGPEAPDGGRQRGAAQRGESGWAAMAALPENVGAWLHIAPSGAVTVFTGKVEVGQGVRTSLAQEVAQELAAPFDRITLVMGDTARTPFDMGTFGSRTTPMMGQRLRHVAAAAREVLLRLAAEHWRLGAERQKQLRAEGGRVRDPSTGRELSYGALAQGRELAEATYLHDALTPGADWTIAGRSVPKVNGAAVVTGAFTFPSDITRPNLRHGKVIRPPAFGCRLLHADGRAAERMPGVRMVRDGDFLGVTAPSLAAAERAARAVRAEWTPAPEQPASADLFPYLRQHAEAGEARDQFHQGSMAAGMRQAAQRGQATYTVAYIQHAPMETRAAVAEWRDGGVTVWTGTQRPFATREALAEAFHLPRAKARVLVPDTGSAFGGKHTPEAALEAARLARAAGAPVRLQWTREEEFTWAYFRPAGVITVAWGVAADGSITAWEFHNYNSGAAAVRTQYAIPNQRIAFHPTAHPLRQGSYRALAATANCFARESAMDEMAHAVGMDPLAFRLKNLRDERMQAVYQAAARAFGWPRPKTEAGQGFGFGGGTDKGGRVATCAEILMRDGHVEVRQVVSAWESGAVIDPDNLRNQITGAAILGLGGALFEAVEFSAGQVETDRFSRYAVPRFAGLPRIAAVLVNRPDLPPAGAGEIPIVGIAPALANAIFDASGERRRDMPLARGTSRA